MLVQELSTHLRQRLSGKFPPSEVREMVSIIFENLKGWNVTDTLVNSNREVTDYIVRKADQAVDRILADEPIQYIFGSAHFYGMNFNVTPDTLIPRQETAQLVDIIVKEWSNRQDLNILDLGTGSGCIAIALARNLPFSNVTAVDISDKALLVARENAERLRSKVIFEKKDIFAMLPPVNPLYDIIVSNPPYIADSEAAFMEPNVLEHEPHGALFVPDSNPLVFYKAISVFAKQALNQGGKLYFEINPLYASELVNFMKNENWDDVFIERDMQKQYRFLIATQC
ncbi:MAG: peptide chain release factor N(5)-glutamine methyltransferase [Muribaculaceae bacterium]|nr:peptide chain release factor N(5)-glutamine methyltransferase [Muribaculaceae bacterium]